MRVLKVHMTSSTDIGLPSCHFASGLRLKETQDLSSGTIMLSAMRP